MDHKKMRMYLINSCRKGDVKGMSMVVCFLSCVCQFPVDIVIAVMGVYRNASFLLGTWCRYSWAGVNLPR